VTGPAGTGPRLIVWSRAGCLLCEEFIAELAGLAGTAFEVQDVDADPETRSRYGARVPVLTADGREVCAVHLDSRGVRALLAPGSRGARLL